MEKKKRLGGMGAGRKNRESASRRMGKGEGGRSSGQKDLRSSKKKRLDLWGPSRQEGVCCRKGEGPRGNEKEKALFLPTIS